MLERPQTAFNVRPEFSQNIGDCIRAQLHAKPFKAFGSRLAVGIIPGCNRVYPDIAGNLSDIESRRAIIPARDKNSRSRIVSPMPERPGSEPKISRVIVEQCGQNRVGDITADDLIAESTGVVVTEYR